MDTDFSGNGLQDIAVLVGALLALGLALQAGVGPTVMYLTEAVKDAFRVRSGAGGLLAILVGSAIGLALGFLTAIVTEAATDDYIGLALIGLFAGLFMGAGAVKSHKASGSVNTDASMAIAIDKASKEDQEKATNFETGYTAGYREAERTAQYNQSNGDGPGLLTSPGVHRMAFAPAKVTSATADSEASDVVDWDDDGDDIDGILAEGPDAFEGLCDCTPNPDQLTDKEKESVTVSRIEQASPPVAEAPSIRRGAPRDATEAAPFA